MIGNDARLQKKQEYQLNDYVGTTRDDRISISKVNENTNNRCPSSIERYTSTSVYSVLWACHPRPTASTATPSIGVDYNVNIHEAGDDLRKDRQNRVDGVTQV